jgi:predicted  nucleic acid-binding Zn-ribbon protein
VKEFSEKLLAQSRAQMESQRALSDAEASFSPLKFEVEKLSKERDAFKNQCAWLEKQLGERTMSLQSVREESRVATAALEQEAKTARRSLITAEGEVQSLNTQLEDVSQQLQVCCPTSRKMAKNLYH